MAEWRYALAEVFVRPSHPPGEVDFDFAEGGQAKPVRQGSRSDTGEPMCEQTDADFVSVPMPSKMSEIARLQRSLGSRIELAPRIRHAVQKKGGLTKRQGQNVSKPSPRQVAPIKTGPIKVNEATTCQDFVNRSVVGDKLEGHELLQHAKLNLNGLATAASHNSPVIALDRAIHINVNTAQRESDAANTTLLENISANAHNLGDLKAAPESVNTNLNKPLFDMPKVGGVQNDKQRGCRAA